MPKEPTKTKAKAARQTPVAGKPAAKPKDPKASHLYREGNPWPNIKVLNDVVGHFMTELWDWNFSQTEIREAFTEALSQMNHYAGGQERRC